MLGGDHFAMSDMDGSKANSKTYNLLETDFYIKV